MAEYVLLDTCIYRDLGNNFYNHELFIELKEHLQNNNKHFIVSEIVEEELYNYFEPIIEEAIDKYNSGIKTLSNNAFYSYPISDLIDKTEAIKYFKKSFIQLFNSEVIEGEITLSIKPNVEGKSIVEFYYQFINKQEKRIKEIKDFLIWDSILNFAQEIESQNNSNKLIFLTKNMKDFQSEYFQNILKFRNVSNVEIIEDINKYLEAKEEGYSFINEDFLIKYIPPEYIERELLKDPEKLFLGIFPISSFRIGVQRKIKGEVLLDILKVADYKYYESQRGGKKIITIEYKLLVKTKFTVEENDILASYHRILQYRDSLIPNTLIRDYEIPYIFEYEAYVDINTKHIKGHNFINYYFDKTYLE